MVLDHVADRAGGVVIRPPAAGHADLLGHRDLHRARRAGGSRSARRSCCRTAGPGCSGPSPCRGNGRSGRPGSRRAPARRRGSARGRSARSWPNGFSMTTRLQGRLLLRGVDQARLAQLLDDRREELGGDRQVIDAGCRGCRASGRARRASPSASGSRPGRRTSRGRRRSGWRTAARPRRSRRRRSWPGSSRTRRGGRRRSSRGGRSRRWRIRTGGCRPARAETGPGPACDAPGRRSRRRGRRRRARGRGSAATPRARGWSRQRPMNRTSASSSRAR